MDFNIRNRSVLPPTIESSLRAVCELIREAGEGTHYIMCLADLPVGTSLFETAHFVIPEGRTGWKRVSAEVASMADFTEVLGWGLAVRAGALAMRTERESRIGIRGWTINRTGLQPLTGSELSGSPVLADAMCLPEDPRELVEYRNAYPILPTEV
ncbi:hypothetical protein [Streptomyces sp. BRA346]|uniref:hypothetical protein n=1 Tax=Streptomyces sp. BRA346 TaxID=2878199 RepID=UPI004062C9AE